MHPNTSISGSCFTNNKDTASPTSSPTHLSGSARVRTSAVPWASPGLVSHPGPRMHYLIYKARFQGNKTPLYDAPRGHPPPPFCHTRQLIARLYRPHVLSAVAARLGRLRVLSLPHPVHLHLPTTPLSPLRASGVPRVLGQLRVVPARRHGGHIHRPGGVPAVGPLPDV